jgi:hypothetical protein
MVSLKKKWKNGGVGYPPAVLAARTRIVTKDTAKTARRTADQIQVPAFNVRCRVVSTMRASFLRTP